MARDKENYNRWFREYYKTHKKQYFEKAEKHKEQKRQWFETQFADILVCSRCGENDRVCLDFHHTDPKTKDYSVSWLLRYGAKAKIISEVNKCIVLCANCHRKEHAKMR